MSPDQTAPDLPPKPGDRLAWVDIAKGLCMVAVVALWVGRAMEWKAGWIVPFETFARPFRMPDFFLLSGLFVGAVLHRPWRSYLDTKVVHYWYFLLLWTLILVPLLWLGGSAQRPVSTADALALLAYRLYKPEAMLWFILMLPLYFVAARLLQRLPVALVLPLAALAMVAQPHTGIPPLDWFAKYFVFFYAGHVLSARVLALAQWARAHPVATLALLAAWVPLNHWFTTGAHANEGAALLVFGFLGIAAVVLGSAWLSRWRAAGLLRWLGSQSLVIYLGFFIPMLAILRALRPVAPRLGEDAVATLAWAGSIAVALALGWALRRTPLRWLYERPAWLTLRPRAASAEAGALAASATSATSAGTRQWLPSSNA
jgi:uncharacterized membrane protein YcfT